MTNVMKSLDRYLLSVNAKDIGLLYSLSAIIGGVIGLGYSMVIRTELSRGGRVMISDINISDLYNTSITILGLLMIFYFVMPYLVGFLGNYFTPIMIGSIDMSMPRLNNISYWLFNCSLLLILYSTTIEVGPGAGWTLYVPLSTIEYSPSSSVDMLIFSLLLAGISSLLGSINFITTIINNRIKGYSMLELPIFVWCIFITNILLLLALPVLTVGITLVLTDRTINTGWYNSEIGGDPVLYQHLFWLFGLPEVFVRVIWRGGVNKK